MRRLAACLILSLAFAAPATAQQGRITVSEPVKDAALRGTQSAAPAPLEAPPLLLPLPVQPTSISSTGGDASRCRTACSRIYYFCLAGEDDTCPRNWSRCVSGCGT